MKYLRFVFFAPLLMAFQCESDDPAAFDILDSTGLLGRWELQDEIINGNISDMIPRCCEFMEFDPDDDITDNKGYLSFTDSQGLVNNGTFEVDLENQTIMFMDDENDPVIFDFSINESQENLTVDFSEDGTNYTQTWARIE